ncbi:MAG: hypothetical protein GXX82_07945 [Syntrophorhabdus sp.]|nr:hypothetical protein [Syntrophorhabdus sp.]
MNKRSGRFFITYFFTSLFLLLLLLPCFPGNAAARDAVDPYYLWHLFTGSAKMESETLSTVVTDEAGNIFIAAAGVKWNPSQETNSKYGSPGQPLHWHSGNADNNRDILVIKFGPDGEFKWYTYYGGYEYDTVKGMAIVDDRLYITGTSRDNWSGPNNKSAVQDHSRAILHPSHSSGVGYWYYEYSTDIFVLALNKYNGEYQWHTFIGESNWDEEAYGIAADKERIFLVGKTDHEFFGCWPETYPSKDGEPMADKSRYEKKNRPCKPTRGYQGSNDAWVLALNTNGYYVAHTFLGGSESNDWGEAIAIDKNGMVVVAGASDQSWNYTHAWYNTPPRNDHTGGYDMFIARLARSDLECHWHAFFGGTYNDWATAVVTDDSNGYYLAGYSKSGWKVKDREPVDPHTQGTNNDFVVVKMNNEGANGWHTFRGGIDTEDVPHAMAMSLYDNTLLVAGEARGPWTLIDGKKPLHNFTGASGSTADMAILGLNPLSGKSQWHTFYGSDCIDRAYSIASSVTGDIVVAGVSDKSWNGKNKSGTVVKPKWQFPSEAAGLNPNFAVLKLRPYSYTITASVKNNLGGTIDPSGVYNVGANRNATFTFTPAEGYEVYQVIVDGETQSWTENSYTFVNVADDHTLQVVFKKIVLTITAKVNGGNGMIDPIGKKTVNYGEDISFRFMPNSGYEFDQVFIDGALWSKSFPYDAYKFSKVKKDHTIEVTFRRITSDSTYYITPKAGANGTITPSTDQSAKRGSSVTFTATANLGYVIETLTKIENGRTSTIEDATETTKYSYSFKNVQKNGYIKATFKKAGTYLITASAGNWGSISDKGTKSYNGGATPTYTFTPNDGYIVDIVTVDRKSVVFTDNKYTFAALDSDHTIHVTFRPYPRYAITAKAGANGSISPPGTTIYDKGATPTYTVIPDDGYVVDKFKIDGNVADLTNNQYTFSPLDDDYNITVTFKSSAVTQYTITPTSGDNGSISPSAATKYDAGSTPTFTFTPNNGYVVDKVTVDGSEVTITDNTYTFAALTKDHTINVTFKEKSATTYTITAEAMANGTIQPLGDTTYEAGATPTYQFVPDENYRVFQVYVDDALVTFADDQYTFSALDNDHVIYVTFKEIPSQGS